MNCSGCGKRLSASAKFCSECGVSRTAVAAPVPSSTKKEVIAKVAKGAGQTALGAAKFVSETAKDGVRSDMGKSMAMGAIAGAVIATPLPFVGTALGASVGALIGAWKKF